MPKLVLYHHPISAPSRGSLLAIRNLNLEVEVKIVNLLAKEQLNPDYIKINPQHTVPTIDDNGFYLWESRAISQYLVESKTTGNSTLYSNDAKQKALINQRLYFDAGTLYPRIRAICFPILFLGETKIPDDKRKQLLEALEFMNIFLEGNKWFCGDNVTIADLSLLASFANVVNLGVDINQYPKLAAWYENCKALPGFDENEVGAKIFANAVLKNATDKF